MDARSKAVKRSNALVVADGGLLTAGASAVAIGLMLIIWGLAGSPEANLVTQMTSSFLVLAGTVTGIGAAWVLNGRHFDRFSLTGAVLGFLLVGLVAPLVGVVSWFAGLFLGLFTTWEFAGPAAVLAVAVTSLVAVAWWVVADALADLRADRIHVALDRARIASVAAVVLTSAGALAASLTRPGSELGEAGIFIILAAAGGAMSVAGALVAANVASRPRAVHAGPR